MIDPDVYVNWLRCEAPGENPRWESKCGVIIQMWSANDREEFWGYHFLADRKTLSQKVCYTTFSKSKRMMEHKYFALHPEDNRPAY